MPGAVMTAVGHRIHGNCLRGVVRRCLAPPSSGLTGDGTEVRRAVRVWPLAAWPSPSGRWVSSGIKGGPVRANRVNDGASRVVTVLRMAHWPGVARSRRAAWCPTGTAWPRTAARSARVERRHAGQLGRAVERERLSRRPRARAAASGQHGDQPGARRHAPDPATPAAVAGPVSQRRSSSLGDQAVPGLGAG